MPTFYGPPSDGTVIPSALEDALAADLRDRATPLSKAARTRQLTELRHDFRDAPDGPVPAEFDTGQPFLYAGEPPIIESGAFVTPTPDTRGKATYLETPLDGKLVHVGAEFIIRRTADTQTNGSLAMGAWSDPGVVTTFSAGDPYPVSGAHFVINRDRWTYNFYADTDPSDVASGTFKTPLAEGVPLTVELFFDGPRVSILLPNGERATFTDPRADEHIDSRPFWEPFMEGGNVDTNVAITQVWADSDADVDQSERAVTRRDLEVQLATRPYESYSTQWRPSAGDQYVNLTTSQTVLNPELYVDFPLPASRQFVITASALLERVGNSTPYWAFTGNTSVTLGVVKLDNGATVDSAGAKVNLLGHDTVQLFVDLSTSGSFKAGQIIRIAWAQYMSGTDRVTFQVRNGHWPTLTVTPVNGRVVTTV